MSNSTLDELATYAETLYTQPHNTSLLSFDNLVRRLSSCADAFQQCLLLLQYNQSVNTQTLASSIFLKLLTSHHTPLPPQQAFNIQRILLTFLTNNENIPQFVVLNLIECYCLMTKQTWFEVLDGVAVFQQIPSNLNPLLINNNNVKHNVIALKILSQLVCLMSLGNGSNSRMGGMMERRTCLSFRDTCLQNLFQLSIDLLHSTTSLSTTPQEQEHAQTPLLTEALKLHHHIFCYSFIEACSDESSSLQLPASWKKFFVDGSLVKLLVQVFRTAPTPLLPSVLACLVEASSARRSLFTNVERGSYLADVTTAIVLIITSNRLTDTKAWHEVCRMLARLKANFQLAELIRMPEYNSFINIVCHFTLSCLKTPEFPANSTFYLLSFWHKLLAPIPYITASQPHHLEALTPQVFEAFLSSKIETAQFKTSSDNPLDDLSNITPQLELISTIGRHDFAASCQSLFRVFDALCNNNAQFSEECTTWVVMVMGALVAGRTSYNTSQQDDLLDAELVARVLKLMGRKGGGGRLEEAIIYFLDHFRKAYVGDQVHKTSNVYKRLDELVGVSGELMMLEIIVKKILDNLDNRADDKSVLEASISLLNCLSTGHSTAWKLLKLPQIQMLLTNHSEQSIGMLNSREPCIVRLRSRLYGCLGRMVVVDSDAQMLDSFLKPLQDCLEKLQFSSNCLSVTEVEDQVTRVCRDLRGVSESLSGKAVYMKFFHWIFPFHLTTLTECLHKCNYTTITTTALLKLVNHICSNKLTFESSSPNGILLFKHVSLLLQRYGNQLLQRTEELDQADIYTLKLKSMITCFRLLRAILESSYVNCGVFEVYSDVCLRDLLSVFVSLVLSLKDHQLMDYPKLKSSYLSALEVVSEHHSNFLSSLQPPLLSSILLSIEKVISSLDWNLMPTCCCIVDNFTTHLFKTLSSTPPPLHPSYPLDHPIFFHLQQLQQPPHFDLQLLKPLLGCLLRVVVLEECSNLWPISRPLLVLIILNEQCFKDFSNELAQVPSGKATACFEALMKGIEVNLSNKNRDRFTLNLTLFKREIQEALTPLPQ